MISKGSVLKIIVVLCILLLVWYSLLSGKPKRSTDHVQHDSDLNNFNDRPSSTVMPIKPTAKHRNGKKCHLVVCSMGNLGNQIWEYMSLYVVWKRFINSGYIPSIEYDMWDTLKVLFPNLTIRNTNETTEICADIKELVIYKTNPLEEYAKWFDYKHDEVCKNIYLDQYSSRYDEILAYGFDKIRQEEMSFSPKLIEESQSLLHYYKGMFNLTNEDVTFVGMHYRGGDYLSHLETQYPSYKLVIPDYRFYIKAMQYFKNTYKNVIFILITIDMRWLYYNKEPIMKASNGKIDINPYISDRLHDLVLLSHCNHSIINYGTFGTTAALFAGGTTFVYNLTLPLDHRGTTVAMGIAEILKNWYAID